jgi:hypothetical protein
MFCSCFEVDPSCLFIVCLISTINNCFESFDLSSHVLHYYLIKIVLVACHLKNYLCYHLPTRGRVGVKLGDVDTSQTYL